MELYEMFDKMKTIFEERQRVIDSQKSMIEGLQERIRLQDLEKKQAEAKSLEFQSKWEKLQKMIGGINND